MRFIWVPFGNTPLTLTRESGRLSTIQIENTLMKISTHLSGSPRELPVGARQRGLWCGIPFGVASRKERRLTVGEDGYGPIQPADLLGSHEAPQGVN